MLLPSKYVQADQALVSVGGQILLQLDKPRTVPDVWRRVNKWRREHGMQSFVPFWWFSLAMDVVFTIGAIDISNGQLMRVDSANSTGK
ncbi:ABC-three component system middle component 6 [Paenarthrobacter nitroguajacolicus]|uniref:ABC-three component system middle component 6 n=1 Tax=Paenarthrobacter nitroguajacolicus TaxID=211146 RepID=UPI002855DE01|nr:hypothetical protein [Paenarthrobacter nitroguajacolicus]